jgi:phospholipid transport system substrate-binding protein
MRLAVLAAALSFLLPAAAAAQEPEDARAFVEVLVVDLAENAGDETRSEAERNAAFRAILREALATEAIGRFLFAGAPTKLATEEQKAAYDALFPDYIAASFADQIGELAEREIIVTGAVPRPNETIVQSKLIDTRGDERAKIDWRVRAVDGEPRLLDVLVERVSPLLAKRQEFSAIAEREGVEALLAHMREVVGKTQKDAAIEAAAAQ